MQNIRHIVQALQYLISVPISFYAIIYNINSTICWWKDGRNLIKILAGALRAEHQMADISETIIKNVFIFIKI